MEDLNEEQIGPQMVTVPAIEIIRKLKTKIDRQNFCRENSKNINLIFRLVHTYKWARIRYKFCVTSDKRGKESKYKFYN